MSPRRTRQSILVPALTLFVCLISRPAHALSELFELYSPPQVVAMGGAITADAQGYLANFYNPAGVAKLFRRKPEFHLFSLEGNFGMGGIGAIFSTRSLGLYQLTNYALTSTSYTYASYSSVTSISYRNFSLAVLGNFRFAGLSDGTTLDMDSVADLVPTLGFGYNFFKNTVKVGVSGKAIIRNQWKGQYTAAQLTGDTAIPSLGKEGLGIGADAGITVTYPDKWLPTAGFVWRDIMGTRFTGMPIFNSLSTGAPETIAQSMNFGASLRPALGKRVKGLFSAELKHIERPDLPMTQRLHFGFQVDDEKSWFFWVGLNQIYYPCGGLALRLPGGNLEFASYGQDVGNGADDRRFLFRYTISF